MQLLVLAFIGAYLVLLGRHLIVFYFERKERYFKSTIGANDDGMER